MLFVSKIKRKRSSNSIVICFHFFFPKERRLVQWNHRLCGVGLKLVNELKGGSMCERQRSKGTSIPNALEKSGAELCVGSFTKCEFSL